MPGFYIRCDKCGATIEGRHYDLYGHSFGQAAELVKIARDKGWTGDMTECATNDRCPACAVAESIKVTVAE